MRTKLAIFLFLIGCIFAGTVFAADKEEKSIDDLTPWSGDSVSIVKLYENEAGERFFEQLLAQGTQGIYKKNGKRLYLQFVLHEI